MRNSSFFPPLLPLGPGVYRLIEDANRLEPYFINLASGQE